MHTTPTLWQIMLVILTSCAAAVAVWAAIYWPMIRQRKVSLWSLVVLTALVAVALGIVRAVQG